MKTYTVLYMNDFCEKHLAVNIPEKDYLFLKENYTILEVNNEKVFENF